MQRSPANAISIELIELIGGIFENVADDPSIRAVILTGVAGAMTRKAARALGVRILARPGLQGSDPRLVSLQVGEETQ